MPPSMRSSTIRRPAHGTDVTGLPNQTDEGNLFTLNHSKVVNERRCEYNSDCLWRAGSGPIGRQTSRPRARAFPFQIKLRVAKRATQLNPVRVDSASQFENGIPLELRKSDGLHVSAEWRGIVWRPPSP